MEGVTKISIVMETQTPDEITQQKQQGPTSNSVSLSSNIKETTTQYHPFESEYNKITTQYSPNEEPTPYNDKQIVVYDPLIANQYNPPPPEVSNVGPQSLRVLPSVGKYAVQCAKCYKWRFIQTKETYEEIREHIIVQPFTCEFVKEWRGDVSCDTPGDVEQDESVLWAIDKPSIPQTPPGWDRDLRIRAQGSANFADVYYVSPLGKKLRSIVEVQKYLFKHPEFIAQGVTLSQFSFKIPKPLQKNYVRRNTPRLTVPCDSNFRTPGPLQTIEADSTTLQLSAPDDISSPAKKKARPSPEHTHKSNPLQYS